MQTKLKSKKWKSLVSGILLAASASSFLIAPVFAAEYTDPLTGVVDDDLDIFGDDGNTVKLDKATNTITYDFQGQDHTFTVENDDGITASQGDKYSYIFNNVGADGSKGTLHIYQSNNQWNPYAGVNGFIASGGKMTMPLWVLPLLTVLIWLLTVTLKCARMILPIPGALLPKMCMVM